MNSLPIAREHLGFHSAWLALLGLLSPVPGHAADPIPPPLPAVTASEPSRVVVTRLQAFAAGDHVVVGWDSVLEIGLISYDVYRDDGARRVRVNAEPVAATGAMSGGRYFVRDIAVPARSTHRYELEGFLITGRSLRLASGDFTANATAPDSASGPQGAEEWTPATPAPEPGRDRHPVLAAAPAPVELPTSSARLKITTRTKGIHFVSAASLVPLLSQDLGTIEAWIETQRLALSNLGNPVNYIPGTAWISANQTGNGLFFYAEEIRNNYTQENAYFLGAGANEFTRYDAGNPAAVTPGSYQATFAREDDQITITPLVSDPEEDFWMMRAMNSASSLSRNWATRFDLDHLVRDAGISATLTVRLFGGSDLPHRVSITLNGTVLRQGDWLGRAAASFAVTCPSTLLKDFAAGEGSNTLVVTALLSPEVPAGVSADQVYGNGFALTYPRRYQAVAGALEAGSDGNSVITITGFNQATTPTFAVFDVTDPRRIKQVTGFRVSQDLRAGVPANTWQVSLTPEDPASSRYAVNLPLVQAYPSTGLRLTWPAQLDDPATRASYLIIAPDALLPEAETMATYRGSHPTSPSLRTKIVLLDDLFNAYSHGLTTPHAIKAFVAAAYANWSLAPRYLLLLGSGTYDYRNLRGYGDNLVPPLMISTPYGLFTSDSQFGDVLGAGTPRVAVGRLPVLNATEFSAVFAKLQSYEAERPASPLKALLVADRPDAAGDFVRNITDLAGYLTPRYESQLLYPPPYPVPANPPPVDAAMMQAAIRGGLDAGVELLDYVGHGAMDRFGSGSTAYLLVEQGPPLSLDPPLANAQRLPVLLAMTCVAGQYSSPGYTCLAEALLNLPGRGVAAAVAPTGLSQDADAMWINRRLTEILTLSRRGRLGDMVLQSFAQYTRQPRNTPVWIYNLMGDPALLVKTTGD